MMREAYWFRSSLTNEEYPNNPIYADNEGYLTMVAGTHSGWYIDDELTNVRRMERLLSE